MRLFPQPLFLFPTLLGSAGLGLGLAVVQAPAAAQTAAVVKAPGGMTYTGANLIYKANGIRLEGGPGQPAHLHSPELDVTADAIAFDVAAGTISEVRAVGNVKLKLSLASKTGGEPALVDTTSEKATLVPATRKLTLETKVNGYYQVPGGPRNNLRGDVAVLSYLNKNIAVNVDGGKDGVLVTLPPEDAKKLGALGTVVIASRKLDFDGLTGVGHFTGNAHAFSTDGPNKFDVTAPEFLLTKGADGTISVLRCVGHTTVLADMPPQPTAPAPAAVDGAAAGGAAVAPGVPAAATPAAGTESGKKSGLPTMGRPTRVNATADGAVVDRSADTLTFDGHVKGFYTLNEPTGPQNYNFSGGKAVFHYTPGADKNGGMDLQVTGAPVTVDAPGLNLGL